jgi:hypothetical protein
MHRSGARFDLQTKLPAIIVVLLGVVAAIVLGNMIGNGALVPVLAFFGGAAVLALVLILKGRIWLLVPACWYLLGNFGSLPFSVRELSVLLTFAVFIVLIAFRIMPFETRFGLLDAFVLLNLVYLATVYLRNPVGVSALGSATVGGRPYFETVIAVLAYFVLTRAPLSPRTARVLPCLIAFPQIAVSILSALTHVIPQLGPIAAVIYSDVEISYDDAGMPPGGEADPVDRVVSLDVVAETGALALFSYFSPLSLLNPARLTRFVMFALVCLCFAVAGYRNGIAMLIVSCALAAYFRGGLREALPTLACVLMIVLGLVGVQSTGLHLPLTAQRALSFLPGSWDYEAKAAAEESSEWRFYMWQQALTTDEFIKNKLLGDGFGFSAYELQIMEQQAPNTGSPFIGGDRQESQMIQGAFHSGPVSAIRFVGYVGLVLYLVLSFFAAFYAWGLIRATAATPFFPLALFIGIPVIYGPIKYIFIFGGYESGFPTTIFLCGMLRLLSAGFSRWRREESDFAPEVQQLANSSA